MAFGLPSVDEIVGLPGVRMALMQQKSRHDESEFGRKRTAYNALRNIYGDIAGDPVSATQLNALSQSQQKFPLEMEQQRLTNETSRQKLTQGAELHPYKVAGEQAEINQRQQTTEYNRERTEWERRNNQQAAIAEQAGAALFGVSRAEHAIANGGDPEQIFGALPPEAAKAFGVTPEQMVELGRAAKADPTVIPALKERLQELRGGGSAGSGTQTSLTDADLDYAATYFRQTGKIPPMGQGKSGTAAREAILRRARELATAEGAAAPPGAAGASGDIKTQQETAGRKRFVEGLAQTRPGTAGGLVRSASTAIEHMHTLDSLIDALGNGNARLVNAARQEIARQTGKEAPTNFETAKTFVADELTRFFVGAPGALADRQHVQGLMDRASSPAQLRGAIKTATELMAGQLKGMRLQAESFKATDKFDAMLTPRARAALTPADAAPKFQEGMIYRDKSGARARYEGGKWVPVP